MTPLGKFRAGPVCTVLSVCVLALRFRCLTIEVHHTDHRMPRHVGASGEGGLVMQDLSFFLLLYMLPKSEPALVSGEL